MIWEKLAKEWRIQNPIIDRDKLNSELGMHLDKVKKDIEENKSVPSAFDEIFSDDDEDDEDW